MANCSDLPKLKFCGLEKRYTTGKDVSFDIVLLSYKSSVGDEIVLCGYNEGNQERDLLHRPVVQESCSLPNGRMFFVFKACEFRSFLESKFKFKYLSADSVVIAQSCSFEFGPFSISEESFLTVDSSESLDSSSQLIKKASKDNIGRLEAECKKLQEQLQSMHRRSEDYEACCKMLKIEKDRVLHEYEEEKRQREKGSSMLKELEGSLLDKIQCIDEQNRHIEELERNIRMEEQLHNALREDYEGQTSSSEECIVENDMLRAKILEYKKDYTRLNKMSEDERDFHKKEVSRHENEITQLKQMYQRKLGDTESKLAEAASTIRELEEKFIAEKSRTASLETKLQDLTREFDEQMDLKDFEFAEVKKQHEDLQEILDGERDAKVKVVNDYESTIEELENKLSSDSKKVDFLTTKCDGMQRRATEAEFKVEDLTVRLEEADKKMLDMEDLVKNSKSELEVLKKTASAPETGFENCAAMSKKVSKEKTASKPLSRTSSKGKEYPVSESKLTWSREREQVAESSSGRMRHSTSRIVFSYSESKRGASRYSARRKSSFQEDTYFEKEKSKSFQKPEKQTGLLRQHRNALLRENSRLRYTMTMLNHDCAILNYTLQQVVSEAEQKLESLYSLYARKESECAAYESMFGSNSLNYEPHGVPGDYVEPFYPDGQYMQNGMVAVNYGYFGEPYYDAYRPQDIMMQPQAVVDQSQFQPLQFAPQMYVPPQQLYCAEPYHQVQYDVPTVQG